jgi:mannose-6-phosphate isomerase-like protein (cupin superfamily)
MAELRIIRAEDVEPQNIRGEGEQAGHIRRMIATDKFFFNVDEINPGFSPHRWHRHTKYRAGGYEVEYPADFEELYFVLSGRGVIQWKADDGTVRELTVGPGDAIHMPAGAVEHQLLNSGTEPIRIVVVGVPPPRRTRL